MASDTRRGLKSVSSQTDETPRRPVTGSAVTLTGRGGLVVVAAFTVLGSAGAALIGQGDAVGLLFVVGCVLAVLMTRRADLLTLVVSPPLIFFVVAVLSGVLGSLGDKSFVTSVALSVATTLTSSVPWLFLGAVLVVVIAVPRGLPAALRELSERVAADSPFSGGTSLLGRASLRGRRSADEDPVRWDDTPGHEARTDAEQVP